MEKSDIKIGTVTMNVLDTTAGNCVISEEPIDYNSEFEEFLQDHIYRLFSKDDVKQCEFKAETGLQNLFAGYSSEKFVNVSSSLCSRLYRIMERNIDIPPADVFIVECRIKEEPWIAVLKANYKTLYGHISAENTVDLAIHRNLIPAGTTQLTEAAVINTATGKIRMVEKKYDVNGIKTNYFSSLFLQCQAELSDKAKISILNRTIHTLVDKYYDDETQKDFQIKAKLAEKYEEEGDFNFSTMGGVLFDDELIRGEFEEKLDKYGIRDAKAAPVTEAVKNTLCTQEIITETGIKIIIPLDAGGNQYNIEFSSLDGGSILIKNTGILKRK